MTPDDKLRLAAAPAVQAAFSLQVMRFQHVMSRIRLSEAADKLTLAAARTRAILEGYDNPSTASPTQTTRPPWERK